MSNLEPAIDLEELLVHADWVRGLARTLVRDPEVAADVEQDSWLEVLRRPPRHARNLRALLARIVRSAAARSARSRGRRHRREEAAASAEALPATVDVVAQAERQRELAGRVLAMREPLRTVILLRFFQGLPPREIAARLERPLNTVRSQLQRGLEQLRRELDGEYGDRSAWSALLLPLAADGAVVPTTTTSLLGSLLMGMNAKIALVSAAVIAAVAFGVWRTNLTPRDTLGPGESVVAGIVDPEPPASIGAEPQPSEQPGQEPRSGATAAREPVALAQTGEPAEPDTGFLLHGRTVDLTARPLGGVAVRWNPRRHDGDPIEAVTDGVGSFTMQLPRRELALIVTDENLVAVATGWIDAALWVVVAPAVPMEGRVVDEAQVPIAGASVRVVLNVMSLRDFGRTPDWERAHIWFTTESDAAGRFRIPRVPVVSDRREADSFVSKRGFETEHPPLPKTVNEVLLVVLHPLEEERPQRVAGIVRSPRGTPVAGAEVVYGRQEVSTDEKGRFVLAIDQIYAPMALRAVHRDYTPGQLDDLGRELLATDADIEGVVIVLGPSPLAIEGRVLDDAGAPAPGFHLSLEDGTPLAASGDWAELRPYMGDGSWITVDDEGRFRLPGLLERDYRVRAWNPETGVVLVSDPVPAGTTDLVLRASADALEHLTGQALDRHGEPAPGLKASIGYQEVPGIYGRWRDARSQAVTDENGRFDLGDVPRQGVQIVFYGAHTLSSYLEIPPHADGEPITVVVPMIARFRVALTPDDPADSFEVLDEFGEVVRLSEFHSRGSVVRTRVKRTDEGFPVCICPDDAATIVLYQGDRELRRVPLWLERDGVNVLEL